MLLWQHILFLNVKLCDLLIACSVLGQLFLYHNMLFRVRQFYKTSKYKFLPGFYISIIYCVARYIVMDFGDITIDVIKSKCSM